ncbi:MAG TPA: TetR family transcriptional regulator [Microscillaceae bacterium]|jgi:AcrR family transcriptional regulator|nr:TetR family transcriptional regulator [Microscillaceae bacterium]
MIPFASVKINVNEKIYLRDPEQTQLGKKIINHSIRLIDELGFESFTFKKLAHQINSTEASIYRYFENKHNLLVYLVSWYWSWLEYQIEFQTHNIEDKEQRLRIALKVVAEVLSIDSNYSYVDEAALHRIVVSESPKAYYTKNVDVENTDGFFVSYKSLCNTLVDLIAAYNPQYDYARALASTVLESAHQQLFFSEHLPSLTNFKTNSPENIADYLQHLVFGLVKA